MTMFFFWFNFSDLLLSISFCNTSTSIWFWGESSDLTSACLYSSYQEHSDNDCGFLRNIPFLNSYQETTDYVDDCGFRFINLADFIDLDDMESVSLAIFWAFFLREDFALWVSAYFLAISREKNFCYILFNYNSKYLQT